MNDKIIKCSSDFDRLTSLTRENLINSLSHATRNKYIKNIKRFHGWCDRFGCKHLPASPETVARYLSHEADKGKKINTLRHRLVAIKVLHESNGYLSPTYHKGVQAVFKGIKRTHGSAVTKKNPITVDKLELLINKCSNDLIGTRDKALLIIGFSAALRRSELSNLRIEDIERTDEGIKLNIRRSKTDQEAQGQHVAILNGERLKAIDVLDEWLKLGNIVSGFIFRSVTKSGIIKDRSIPDQMVALIVKKYVNLAKLDGNDFSGHSLRAGFITSAAQNGAGMGKIMEVSRHRKVDTLIGYIREAKIFKNHAGKNFM